MTGGGARRLSVFISHSGADRGWAARLAQALSRMRIPAGYDGGGAAPVRFAPVLPGDHEEDGPESADRLVVICSPRAASSDLVDGEVRAFGRSGLTALLTVDGEPGAGRHEDLAHRECLPPALRDGQARPTADPRPDREGWPGAAEIIAAGLLGVSPRALRLALARRRRKTWGLRAAAVSGAAVGLALGWLAMEERKGVATTAGFRAAAISALDALDSGRDAAALRAFAAAAPEPDADIVWPEEARIAAARLALEPRLLADIPAPASRIVSMTFLPDGALAATGRRGRVFLIDPGAGEHLAVYTPAGRAFERIAPDGRTLWAARREPARNGGAEGDFAPLVFEDVALESGAVNVRAAVLSPPGEAGEGTISPDGALFAVDLGPGGSDSTVIAAFNRHKQALGGILKMPSDRAKVRFVSPDMLLVRIDPPNETAVYLWRVGAERPLALRPPGAKTGCGPALGRAALSVSQDGAEIALLTPVARGGCLERWGADGAALGAALSALTGALTSVAAGGPYLVSDVDGGDGRLIGADGSVIGLAPACGGALRLVAGADRGGHMIACADGRKGALVFDAARGGGEVWRGRFGGGAVTALAIDPARGILASAGRDGRLRFWDAAPKARALTGPGAARRMVMNNDLVALMGADAAQTLSVSGAPAGPVITAPGARAAVLWAGRLGLFTEKDGEAAFTVLDARSGVVIARHEGLAPFAEHARIGAAGRAALLGADGAARLIDMDSGAEIAQVRAEGGPGVAIAAHEGGFAMLTREDGQVALYIDSWSGGALTGVGAWPGAGGGLEISRNGATALVSPDGAPATLIDLRAGKTREVPTHDKAALSPEGAWLVLRSGVVAAAIAAADGAEIPLSQTARGPVLFGPNGVIAIGGAPPVLARRGAPPLCPDALRVSATPRAFSPDGTRVAFETRRGVVALDLATCRIAGATGTPADGRAVAMPERGALWLGAGSGAVILPLDMERDAAMTAIRRRAARLPATE